jgi:O-antigen/teichoic acid export membrane protein
MKDISFKLIDSGLDTLLIGMYLTKQDVAIYSFSSTIALILMNFNVFKITRSFMNLFFLEITNQGKYYDKVNKVVYVYGLVNQITMFVLFIPFLTVVYFALNQFFPNYVTSFPIIIFLTFGYCFYSNYYTLSGLVFVYKNPTLFTRAALIVGVVNLIINYISVLYFDIYVLALSTMMGLIITPLLLIHFINKEYIQIKIEKWYLYPPLFIYLPLFLYLYHYHEHNYVIIISYIAITNYFYFRKLIVELNSYKETWTSVLFSLKQS